MKVQKRNLRDCHHQKHGEFTGLDLTPKRNMDLKTVFRKNPVSAYADGFYVISLDYGAEHGHVELCKGKTYIMSVPFFI